jgi:mannose-6-phosphate isomerase-like protein (cupin superfamily)
MKIRRVVTGHTPEDQAIVVSDDLVATMSIGDKGSEIALIWGRDDPGQFPDDGKERPISSAFPPPSGCRCAMWQLAPEGDEFHEFVAQALTPWSDANEPGMHRTATLDYDIVLEGVIGLELDDGFEVTLRPGDVVVQNGTRHRWHNRGDTFARMLSVTVGAHNQIAGGGRA